MFQWTATSLPQPVGPYKVGYTDLLTPGLPDDSSLLRILYPATEDQPRSASFTPPPLWTDSTPRDNCIALMQSMVFHWPSWAPDTEYLLLPTARLVTNETTFSIAMKMGWDMFAERLTIPILPESTIHTAPPTGWPVVVFSHGMGCTRATMSQLAYQLASQGVVVVCVEHREGSGGGSFYREARGADMVEIPHRLVGKDEEEAEVRERQAEHRAREVLRALELLPNIQAGKAIDNVMSDSSLCVSSPLAGTMDLSALYLLGHSFGGSTVLFVASLLRERGTKLAGVMTMDPWMFPVHKLDLQVDAPVRVLHSEAFVIPENMDAVERAVRARSECNKDVEFEVLDGAVHLSATDIPMVFPQTFIRRGIGFMGEVEPEECIKETNRIVWSFFSKRIEERKLEVEVSEDVSPPIHDVKPPIHDVSTPILDISPPRHTSCQADVSCQTSRSSSPRPRTSSTSGAGWRLLSPLRSRN